MFRKYAGRLMIVAAGGGCLALVFFVVEPRLFEPAAPMPQDEIVAEVPGTDEQSADLRQPDEWRTEEGGLEAAMPVSSPLVGIRNDGAEVAVIFPAAEEKPGEENGLPQALSAEDVAEASTALEGQKPEPVVTAEPDSAARIEEEMGAAVVLQEAAAGVEDSVAAQVVPLVVETTIAVEAERTEQDSTTDREDEAPLSALPAQLSEAVEEASEPVVVASAVERVSAGGDGRPGSALRLADRRGEFDMPVRLNSRARLEVFHPSGGVPDDATAGAAARNVEAGVIVPGTLRGVMGYRLPLISRQEVPDQIVSGVLIPAHTTFVIVKEGSWELVDVTPEELERFREAAVSREVPAPEVEPVRRGWNPLRVFRKRNAPGAQHMDVGQKNR